MADRRFKISKEQIAKEGFDAERDWIEDRFDKANDALYDLLGSLRAAPGEMERNALGRFCEHIYAIVETHQKEIEALRQQVGDEDAEADRERRLKWQLKEGEL